MPTTPIGAEGSEPLNRPSGNRPIAVLGAGNVGMTMAAYLARRGFPVHLYNTFPAEIAELRESRRITAGGAVTGVAELARVTSDMGEALENVALAMVTVPAFAQQAVIEATLPHLQTLRYLVLHPGTVGGALVFDALVRQARPEAAVILAETATSLFSCRKVGPTEVHVRRVKQTVSAAALPATRTPDLLAALSDPFEGRFVAAGSTLETSLNNINPVYHCPPMITNFGRVEAREKWGFADTVSPGIARLIQQVDDERMRLAAALGVARPVSFLEFMHQSYGAEPGELGATIRAAYSPGGGSPLPVDPKHRFLTEDVPYGLVPWVSLGALAGVPMPRCRAMVDLACALNGRDWWAEGRDLGALVRDVAELQRRVLGVRA